MCVIRWCCVYFLKNRSVVGTSIEYTQTELKVRLFSTPKKYCAGNMRIYFFSVQSVLYDVQTKTVIASGSEVMCLRATPLGTYFPEGNLVYIIKRKIHSSL